MKKLMFCFFLLTGTFAFAQEDDVSIEGNTVTVKEKAPVWPGCESSVNTKDCFDQKLMEHVKNNYKYPRNDKGEFIRGKVVVKMHIDEEGKPVVTSVKGDQKPVIAAVETMLKKNAENETQHSWWKTYKNKLHPSFKSIGSKLYFNLPLTT